MRLIRQALGQVVVAVEGLSCLLKPPSTWIDDLVLYHYPMCPYCIRVRCAMTRLGIRFELRDIDSQPDYRCQLIEQGGKPQVPCLWISHQGQQQWLYESADIVVYLKQRLAQESSS